MDLKYLLHKAYTINKIHKHTRQKQTKIKAVDYRTNKKIQNYSLLFSSIICLKNFLTHNNNKFSYQNVV